MRRLTIDEFISKAKSVHGDRYDYRNVVYVNANTPVEIVCAKHGSFFQAPTNHLRGAGCAICNKIDNRKMLLSDFVSRSNVIHNNTYDYSNVKYVNNKTKVEIMCPKHGVFLQTPEKHLIGRGCPKCAPNYPDTRESFIEKARQIHGDLYDYSRVDYINSWTKVCIVDKEYGEFWQKPNAHLRGEGHALRKPEKCYVTKKLNNSFHTSKAENIVAQLLIAKFGEDDVFCQYSSPVYPFACDFYIGSLDLYIELNIFVTHGGHWFDPNSPDDLARLQYVQDRATTRNLYQQIIKVWTGSDLMKRQIAMTNNLNYLVFWDNNLTDFLKWYNSFDETHILKQY